MGCVFTKFKLELVKEKSNIYNIEKKVNSPAVVETIAKDILKLDCEPEEVLYMLSLNAKNLITGIFEISRGTLNSSLLHPREIFKRAILNNAFSIVLIHNHPSGDPTPSKEDIDISIRIKEAGRVLGIELLDHVVIGDKKCSLKEKSLI